MADETVYVPREKVRSNRTLGLGVAIVVFLVDQGVKWVVTYILQLQQRGPEGLELTSFFKLIWLNNPGVSMGFLTADSELKRWLLVGLTAAIAIFVAIWLWREK